MSFLGDIGSLYMLFLIILLIVGLGMAAKGLIGYLFDTDKKERKKAGRDMPERNWFKLSLLSLTGIIISMIILSFLSSQGNMH